MGHGVVTQIDAVMEEQAVLDDLLQEKLLGWLEESSTVTEKAPEAASMVAVPLALVAGEKTRSEISAAATNSLAETALPLSVSEPAAGRLEMMTALRLLQSEKELLKRLATVSPAGAVVSSVSAVSVGVPLAKGAAS